MITEMVKTVEQLMQKEIGTTCHVTLHINISVKKVKEEFHVQLGSSHYLWDGGSGNPNILHTGTQNLPPSTTAHYVFAPLPKSCTEISPPLWCINDVYIFQGMMLANSDCNHESYIGKS